MHCSERLFAQLFQHPRWLSQHGLIIQCHPLRHHGDPLGTRGCRCDPVHSQRLLLGHEQKGEDLWDGNVAPFFFSFGRENGPGLGCQLRVWGIPGDLESKACGRWTLRTWWDTILESPLTKEAIFLQGNLLTPVTSRAVATLGDLQAILAGMCLPQTPTRSFLLVRKYSDILTRKKIFCINPLLSLPPPPLESIQPQLQI